MVCARLLRGPRKFFAPAKLDGRPNAEALKARHAFAGSMG